MRVLVDTHAFFWWVIDKPKLSARARALLVEEDNEVFVSAVVAWELATKARLGKWPQALPIATNIASVIADNRFTALTITIEHARTAGLLAGAHRDPFDRMLAAQSQVEGMPLVSADPVFRGFGTAVMW
ncbi:MAG TPA: type II toxin-antitoxin system VapC family toxin [Xanthobacteraceae bacterium]|nr:type II toxin-antitoxin system VapC family toxin [Xanthobacteraceae bacterium]